MSLQTGQRVLHIVEPWNGPARSWLASGTGSDSLVAACGLCVDAKRHRTLLLGPARAEARAALTGVYSTDSICPPAGRPELAWSAARRFIRGTGPFDAAVCWGGRAAKLARAVSREIPAVFRAELRASEAESSGVNLLGESRPPLSIDRREWRQSHRIADEDVVVVLLDDPSHSPNARRFMFILGTLEVAGRRVVGLAPTQSVQVMRARKFRRATGLRTRVIAADRPVQAMLGACDAGVLLGPFDSAARPEGSTAGAARFNLLLAASFGLPVVTAEHPLVTSGLPQLARECLAHSHHTTDISRALFELIELPGRRVETSAALLAHAGPGAWRSTLAIDRLLHDGPGRIR